MSRASSPRVESFGTVDILNVGRTYRVLSKEFVGKALDKDAGYSRLNLTSSEEIEFDDEQEGKLADCLANQISGALFNFRPDDPENKALNLIEETFAVTRLKKRLENQTNCDSNTFRRGFYERMSYGDDVVATHIEERHGFPLDNSVIQKATDFLLDESFGGVLIPDPVQSRAKEDWETLQKKAKEWSTEYNMPENEACEEVIAATMAVEVHTGGDPDHIEPYKNYVYKERGATWSQLDDDPTHPFDRRLVKEYENKYG